MTIISSWTVIAGFVYPASEEPRLPAGHGPSIDRRRDEPSEARAEIRRRIAERR